MQITEDLLQKIGWSYHEYTSKEYRGEGYWQTSNPNLYAYLDKSKLEIGTIDDISHNFYPIFTFTTILELTKFESYIKSTQNA